MNTRSRIIVILVVVVALGSAGFVWNEARKEVVFLCGNFAAGVTEQSVRRQLDTGSFLRYRTEATVAGTRIVADSPYTLGMYTCVVDIDPQGVVVDAHVE